MIAYEHSWMLLAMELCSLISKTLVTVQIKTWLLNISLKVSAHVWNLQVKCLQEISAHLNLTRRNDDSGSIVSVSSRKTKECNQMADNTSFCSCGCEEKLKFIQMADGGMKSVTVYMSWTLVNRYSAALDAL
jgi:hypothetical protein